MVSPPLMVWMLAREMDPETEVERLRVPEMVSQEARASASDWVVMVMDEEPNVPFRRWLLELDWIACDG